VTCAIGGESLDLGSPIGIWQRIVGWQHKGDAVSRKAGSDIAYRELRDEYACAGHVSVTRRSVVGTLRLAGLTGCSCCGDPVDRASRDAWQRVVGWTSREHPGKDIRGREARDEYACNACVRKMQDGLNPGQDGLFS